MHHVQIEIEDRKIGVKAESVRDFLSRVQDLNFSVTLSLFGDLMPVVHLLLIAVLICLFKQLPAKHSSTAAQTG